MKLDAKLRNGDSEAMWQEYLGFMDLDIEGYMAIQRRLMQEQLRLWCGSNLGRSILCGTPVPHTIEEFRNVVPLTVYDDYAEVLLSKRDEDLPEPAAIWIKTTWEGGKHPIKIAPYTQGMLDTYRTNMGACIIMFGATEKGKFTIGKRVLSGFAPLPYATGLMGLMLRQETDMRFLPPHEEAQDMSFSQKDEAGPEAGDEGRTGLFLQHGLRGLLHQRYAFQSWRRPWRQGITAGGAQVSARQNALCPRKPRNAAQGSVYADVAGVRRHG